MSKGIEIKEGYTLRACDNCSKAYYADNRNLKRGWGKCCSKACAASKREKDKPGYNPDRVANNNLKRANWNVADDMRSYYERNRRNGWPLGVDEGPEGWDGHK